MQMNDLRSKITKILPCLKIRRGTTRERRREGRLVFFRSPSFLDFKFIAD